MKSEKTVPEWNHVGSINNERTSISESELNKLWKNVWIMYEESKSSIMSKNNIVASCMLIWNLVCSEIS